MQNTQQTPTEADRLAIWLKCYRLFSPQALSIRLKELTDGVHNDDDKTAELKILAIRTILKFNGRKTLPA